MVVVGSGREYRPSRGIPGLPVHEEDIAAGNEAAAVPNGQRTAQMIVVGRFAPLWRHRSSGAEASPMVLRGAGGGQFAGRGPVVKLPPMIRHPPAGLTPSCTTASPGEHRRLVLGERLGSLASNVWHLERKRM